MTEPISLNPGQNLLGVALRAVGARSIVPVKLQDVVMLAASNSG